MLKLIKYSRRYYIHIVIAALVCIGASTATVLLTDFLKNLIDSIAAGGDFGQQILSSIFSVLLILLIGICSNYLVVYMTGFVGSGLLKDLRADCIKGLMNASPDYMNNHSRGDIMERVSSDVEGLADFVKGYFKDCLYVPIMVVVYSVYLIVINAKLAVFCLLPLSVLVYINIKFMKPIKMLQFEYNRALGLTNNRIQEAFDGAATIKAYNLQERIEKKYYDEMYRLLKISNSTDLKQYNLEPVSRAVHELPIAVALIIGGFYVFDGTISMGILVAYISVLRSLGDPLAFSYQLVVRSQTALVSVSRVFDVIEIPKERENIGFNRENIKAPEAILEFANVSFRYKSDNAEGNTLENVSFQIKRGEHVAFVGKSGSGKSTVLKLISTFLEADAGEIKYCGVDYKNMPPEFIRQKLALVSQDAVLFPLSVKDNVRIGKADADEEWIAASLKMSGCEGFISDMEDGINTVLNEGASNMSGGQKQRLSLARAIVKDSDIYLFDEPTSALDKETEQLICESIAHLPKDKTVITVAHRLSTITDYDCIYVMDEGRIIEAGKHEELIAERGAYYQMFANLESADC